MDGSLPPAVHVSDHVPHRIIEENALAVRRVDFQRDSPEVCEKAVSRSGLLVQILLIHNDHPVSVNLLGALFNSAELISEIGLDRLDQLPSAFRFQRRAAKIERFARIKRQNLLVIDPVKGKIVIHLMSFLSVGPRPLG